MNERDFLKKLGKRVAYYRKERGMSQTDLCALINMDVPNLSAIENGRQNASSLTLKKIADALEVRVGAFFTGI